MKLLNYETKKHAVGHARLPWTTFVLASLGGVIVARYLDDIVHNYLFNKTSDGGGLVISLFAIPLFGIILKLIQTLQFPRPITAVFAAITGLLAAPIGLGILVVLSLKWN